MNFNEYKGIANLSKIFSRMLKESNSDFIEILDNKIKDIASRDAGQYIDVNAPELNIHLDDILCRLDNNTIAELSDLTPEPIDIPDFSQHIAGYEYLTGRSWYIRNPNLIDRVRHIVQAGYGYKIFVVIGDFSEHVDEILARIANNSIDNLPKYL
jgi:hypothetical protein